MNTVVKRTNSTALGKTCNPSRGPSKHRKGPLSTENDQKGAIGYRRGLYKYDIVIYI